MKKMLVLFVLLVVSLYLAIFHGLRRYSASARVPQEQRQDLVFWGTFYVLCGGLVFTGGSVLGFYWLVKKLQEPEQSEVRSRHDPRESL
jgi:hypothetical protein